MFKFIQKFISFFLSFAIIIIIALTTFFCLDVFEVIDVPKKYSLINLIYSKAQVIVPAEPILDEIKPISEDKNKKIIIDENDDIIYEKIELPKVESAYSYDNNKDLEINQNNDNIIYSVDTNVFYYNQLDEYGKIMYADLYNNKEKLKTGTYVAEFGTTFNELLHQENGSEILNNSFQLAVNALIFDNPELFYIDITKMYLLTEITTKAFSKTYRVSIGPNDGNYFLDSFYSEELANEAIDKVQNVKEKIIEMNFENDYSKIKYVHDYLVDNINYDTSISESNIYNIYGALINGKAVCEGYARSFKYIMDDFKIPCIIACGIAVNSSGKSESHAWNYVKIGEIWYAIDCTWDDPVIIGNGTIDDNIRYNYFLNGSEAFFKDHFEDGNIVSNSNFKYPMLCKTNY